MGPPYVTLLSPESHDPRRDDGEVDRAAEDDERVEHLVVAEDARPGVRASCCVHQGANRVGDTTQHDQPDLNRCSECGAGGAEPVDLHEPPAQDGHGHAQHQEHGNALSG